MTDLAIDGKVAAGAVAKATQLRYAPFGALRLGLALLVLLQHAAAQVAPASIAGMVGPVEPGSIAVYAFFVLSGYIIAEAGEKIYSGRPFAFIANRLLRIVPTYVVGFFFLTLLAFGLLAAGYPMPVEGKVTPELAHLAEPAFYIANLLAVLPYLHGLADPAQPLLVPIIWAVRIELFFYLVFFAAIAISTYGRQPLNRVLFFFGLLTMASWLVATPGSLLSNVPFFVIGVALQRMPVNQGEGMWTGAVAFAFMLAALIVSLAQIVGLDTTIAGTTMHRIPLLEAALFLGLFSAFVVCAIKPIDGGSAAAGLDRKLGELTYPLYINHMLPVYLVMALTGTRTISTFVIAMMAGILVSYIIARESEPKIARLRDLVRGRRLG